MGTYTTNYQLYIPTVGEQGWGTLVNGNFTTIDTTMDNLNTRLTAVESEVNGDLNCTSVTTSGTITSTGKVTANGGIGTTSLTTSSTITSTGKITANGGVGTTSLTTSSTITSTGLITANGGIKGNLTGNATTATNLNRTVTVAASGTMITFNHRNMIHLCPYTPGVLYTGKIKGYAYSGNTSGSITLYCLSSSNGLSTINITATTATEYSISNVKYVIAYVQGSSSAKAYLYLPTFT